jgi:predicted RND superfamily exporter protein
MKFHALKISIAAVLTVLFVVLYQFGLPKMSGDVEALFPRQSTALDDLYLIESQFGKNLVDVIILPIPNPITEDAREEIIQLEERLQNLTEIHSILSPLKAFQSIPIPVRLVSDDKAWARFILEIPADLTDTDRRNLNSEIDKIRPKGSFRSGSFYASEVATSSLEKENQVRAPACIIAILVLLLIWTRSLTLSLKILFPPILTVAIVAAVLSFFDISLGAVAQLVPPLLLAVSTSYSSYIASRLLSSTGLENPLFGAGKSLVLATLTTVIGFVSLKWMDSKGVDDFSMIMTGGTILAAALSWVLVPLFIRPVIAKEFRYPKLTIAFTKLSVVTAISLLLLSSGIIFLNVDTVPLDFFPDNSVEKRELISAEKVFPGSHVLSLVLNLASPISKEQLPKIKGLAEQINSIQGVRYVFGAPEFYRLYQELKKRDLNDSTFMSEFGPSSIVTKDLLHTRLIIETDSEGRALIELADKIKLILAADNGWFERAFLSSREFVIANQSRVLTIGLLESVFSALIIVWLLMLYFMRDLKMSLIGLIPSILPVIGIFGALGFFTENLNLGAAIVAACALGMISDFSFHLLFFWKSSGNLKLEEAVSKSIIPFTLTGLTLLVGFSPTVFSPIAPVRSFGLLLGSSIALGIFLNLTLLPLLLRKFNSSV